MNAKQLIAVTALSFVAAAASAQVGEIDSHLPQVNKEQSTVTREQVRAELVKAHAEGLLDNGEYTMVADAVAAKARARTAVAAKKAGAQTTGR